MYGLGSQGDRFVGLPTFCDQQGDNDCFRRAETDSQECTVFDRFNNKKS